MRIRWNTKKNSWRLDGYFWWKQFRFGFWYDNDFDIMELCIHFAFWNLDLWKYKKSRKNKGL